MVKVAKPFLKWVGGKRALLPVYEPYLPRFKIPYYAEPFVGGGAMYFHLNYRITEMAILSDSNPHLINTYKHVRDRVGKLMELLKASQDVYLQGDRDQRQKHYYRTRELDRAPLWDSNTVYAASRFIFINRTGYNGLWRVNKAGQCNTPHGMYSNPTICDGVALAAAEDALYRVIMWNMDFQDAIHRILELGRLWGIKFFVYLDPPYTDTAFTSYTADGWTDVDTELLITAMSALDIGGHKFMCSNSPAFSDAIARSGEGDHWRVHNIMARRNVNSDPEGRGKVMEILVRNYD